MIECIQTSQSQKIYAHCKTSVRLSMPAAETTDKERKPLIKKIDKSEW